MSLVDEINETIARLRATQTKIYCSPGKYDKLRSVLGNTPDLDGSYEIIVSDLLPEDDSHVYVVKP